MDAQFFRDLAIACWQYADRVDPEEPEEEEPEEEEPEEEPTPEPDPEPEPEPEPQAEPPADEWDEPWVNPADVGCPSDLALVPMSSRTITSATALQRNIVHGGVSVRAAGFSATNCVFENGRVWNLYAGRTYGDMHFAQCTFRVGNPDMDANEGQLGIGGYTMRLCRVEGGTDGVRVSGDDVLIEDCWITCRPDPPNHMDGVQGYGGGANVRIVRSIIDARGDSSTGAVFFADSSEELDIEDCLLMGGAYSLRFNQWERSGRLRAKGVYIVAGSYDYDAVDVKRNAANGTLEIVEWEVYEVEIDEQFRITRIVREIPRP